MPGGPARPISEYSTRALWLQLVVCGGFMLPPLLVLVLIGTRGQIRLATVPGLLIWLAFTAAWETLFSYCIATIVSELRRRRSGR